MFKKPSLCCSVNAAKENTVLREDQKIEFFRQRQEGPISKGKIGHGLRVRRRDSGFPGDTVREIEAADWASAERMRDES